MPCGKPHRQRGYILALNIAVLALMLIGATYIGQRLSLAKTMAQTEKQRVADEIAFESARARVLFLLATAPRSPDGLGTANHHAALDGRPYRVAENVLVSLQDTRGLISVNASSLDGGSRDSIERLLGTYGVDSIEANRLTDILLDYRDTDDLRRINGAEREDYLRAEQESMIRNSDLLAPDELGRLLTWADREQLWQDDPITNHISVEKQAAFNTNTADWRTLVAMTGMPAEAAKKIVEQRQGGQNGEASDMLQQPPTSTIGTLFAAGSSTGRYPGPSILVTLRTDKSTWGEQLLVTHTATFKSSPWHIEYARRVALKPLTMPPEKIPMLPEAATLRDFTTKDQVQLSF